MLGKADDMLSGKYGFLHNRHYPKLADFVSLLWCEMVMHFSHAKLYDL